MRFIGSIEAKADAKGRAFLPATFRKALQQMGEGALVLSKDVFQDCLVLYPQSVWDIRLKALHARLSPWNKDDQRLFRQYVSDVELTELDGNGRFLIPKRYLKLAHIEGQQLRFIGMDEYIEIWNADDNDRQKMDPAEFAKALEEKMSGNETEGGEQ